MVNCELNGGPRVGPPDDFGALTLKSSSARSWRVAANSQFGLHNFSFSYSFAMSLCFTRSLTPGIPDNPFLSASEIATERWRPPVQPMPIVKYVFPS